MISEQTQDEVWNGLLDIERTCRYYEAIQANATRCHFIIRVLTLTLIAGGITAILDLLTPYSSLVAATIVISITGLTIWDVVSNYPKKATMAHSIHLQAANARTEWRDLWLSMSNRDTEEAYVRKQVRTLTNQTAEVEHMAGYVDLYLNRKLNRRITKDADLVVSDRHRTNARNSS